MVMSGRSGNTANPNNIYKFTGKERDDETLYDHFGARFYDSRIGRWLSVDPLASERPGLSPYNYVQNNPLGRIDPTGMLDDWYLDENGVPQYNSEVQSQSDLAEDQTYLGDEGYAINEQSGELNKLNADGTKNSGIFTLAEVNITAHDPSIDKTISDVSLISTAAGSQRGIVNELIKSTGDFSNGYLKVSGVVGKSLAGLSLATGAMTLARSSGSGADYARFVGTMSITASGFTAAVLLPELSSIG